MSVPSVTVVSFHGHHHRRRLAAAAEPGRGVWRVAVPLYSLWLHLPSPHPTITTPYAPWQVCAWLCLFIKDSRLAEIDSKEQPLPKPSAALQEVFGATFELAEILEVAIVSITIVSIAIVPRGRAHHHQPSPLTSHPHPHPAPT